MAPSDAASYRLSGGTILVVACQISVLAYPLPQPHKAPRPPIPNPHLHHWDMVPPSMAVMDATVATEYGLAQFDNSELWCKCGKVCVCHATLRTAHKQRKHTKKRQRKGVRKGYERGLSWALGSICIR